MNWTDREKLFVEAARRQIAKEHAAWDEYEAACDAAFAMYLTKQKASWQTYKRETNEHSTPDRNHLNL